MICVWARNVYNREQNTNIRRKGDIFVSPHEFLLALLASAPDHKIQGRKRLQKMCFLLKCAGADVKIDFRLLHYGVFSTDVADVADELVLTGMVKEDIKPIGIYDTFQSIYQLPSDSEKIGELPEALRDVVSQLNEFTTIELEVASTIAYFVNKGLSQSDALAETKKLKPSKAIRPVIRKAKKILAIVST